MRCKTYKLSGWWRVKYRLQFFSFKNKFQNPTGSKIFWHTQLNELCCPFVRLVYSWRCNWTEPRFQFSSAHFVSLCTPLNPPAPGVQWSASTTTTLRYDTIDDLHQKLQKPNVARENNGVGGWEDDGDINCSWRPDLAGASSISERETGDSHRVYN